MNTAILSSKDPSDFKFYGIDWSAVLTSIGETGILYSYWGSASGNDLASDGAGMVSSATYAFTAEDVGRTLQIVSAGSGFTPGAYVIVSVLAGAATLASSPGANKTGAIWALLGGSSPAGLTVATSPAPSIIGMETRFWPSGGVAGTTYSLTNTIVTNGVTPQILQGTVIIPCAQR
jgi:hypothetical protein